jgi:hypothetical protein
VGEATITTISGGPLMYDLVKGTDTIVHIRVPGQTGLAGTQAQKSINGAAFAATTNTLVHIAGDRYALTIPAAEIAAVPAGATVEIIVPGQEHPVYALRVWSAVQDAQGRVPALVEAYASGQAPPTASTIRDGLATSAQVTAAVDGLDIVADVLTALTQRGLDATMIGALADAMIHAGVWPGGGWDYNADRTAMTLRRPDGSTRTIPHRRVGAALTGAGVAG